MNVLPVTIKLPVISKLPVNSAYPANGNPAPLPPAFNAYSAIEANDAENTYIDAVCDDNKSPPPVPPSPAFNA